jgi:type III pantothenate kinase
MILIDIGNTNIVFAVSNNNKIKEISRIDTNKETKIFIKNVNKIIKNFLDKNFSKNSKKFAVISSVVPHINTHIIKILKIYKIKVIVLKPKDVLSYLKIDYNLNEIGADRIANSVAVINSKILNSIVIDFGTATTFEVLKNGRFLGGLIFPGIELSKNTLIKKTSLLKNAQIIKTHKVVAKNTKAQFNLVFIGVTFQLINGIIKKIIDEKKFKPKIILTGGLAKIFKNDIKPKPIVNSNLTLEGLQVIGSLYYAKNKH